MNDASCPPPVPQSTARPSLRTLTGITLVRRGNRLLDAVDLTILRGERLVILGPNGAGKTLLMQIGHRLLAPDAGRIVDATDSAREAMVFQRPVLLRRSAIANVMYAIRHARPALPRVSASARRERAWRALARVGLEPLAERPARLLSGGEQQRLAIARAAALEPDLIWFDEPTASLDPASVLGIEAALVAMNESGTTCVMSTHDIGQARRIADRIVLMAAGRILEVTPATRFFESPATAAGRSYLAGGLLNV